MVQLTYWGRVTHICVSKITIIGSDNGLLPDRRQAIIWTNARLLLIGPLGINFSETLIEILKFSVKTMRLNVSSAKRRPFCLGLNELSLMASKLQAVRRLITGSRKIPNLVICFLFAISFWNLRGISAVNPAKQQSDQIP